MTGSDLIAPFCPRYSGFPSPHQFLTTLQQNSSKCRVSYTHQIVHTYCLTLSSLRWEFGFTARLPSLYSHSAFGTKGFSISADTPGLYLGWQKYATSLTITKSFVVCASRRFSISAEACRRTRSSLCSVVSVRKPAGNQVLN